MTWACFQNTLFTCWASISSSTAYNKDNKQEKFWNTKMGRWFGFSSLIPYLSSGDISLRSVLFNYSRINWYEDLLIVLLNKEGGGDNKLKDSVSSGYERMLQWCEQESMKAACIVGMTVEEDFDLGRDCILDCNRAANFRPKSINAVRLSPSPTTNRAWYLSYCECKVKVRVAIWWGNSFDAKTYSSPAHHGIFCWSKALWWAGRYY